MTHSTFKVESGMEATKKPEQAKPDVRTRHCAFFLTENDAEELKRAAKSMGFNRGGGQLVTAVVERLIIGGFSPASFIKVALQLNAFAKKNGCKFDQGFYFGVRPLPALPDEHISLAQWKAQAAAITRELEQQESIANTETVKP